MTFAQAEKRFGKPYSQWNDAEAQTFVREWSVEDYESDPRRGEQLRLVRAYPEAVKDSNKAILDELFNRIALANYSVEVDAARGIAPRKGSQSGMARGIQEVSPVHRSRAKRIRDYRKSR